MSYQAVSVINGEFYDGLVQSVEPQPPVTSSRGLVMPSFNIEIDARSGEVKDQGFRQVNSDSLGLSGEGVLSTATNSGFAVRDVADIKDTTVVTVQGIQMSVKSAVELGILSRSAEGRYSETSGKKPDGGLSYAQAPEVDEEASSEEEECGFNPYLFDPDVEGALESIAEDLGGYGALEHHAVSVMGGLTHGDITYSAQRLALAMGAEQAEAEAFISNVADRYRGLASDYIDKTHGVDGEAVIQWMVDNVSPIERTTISHEVFLGQTTALDRMVERFKVRTKQ